MKRSWSQREACRFRRSALPRSATTWRSSSESKIQECRPALVPLVFGAKDREHYCDLAGVSTEVVASIGRQQFREKMLITHRGLSGPAILQISSYWDRRQPIAIDLAPDREITAPLRGTRATRYNQRESRAASGAAGQAGGALGRPPSAPAMDECGTRYLREATA